MHAAPRKRFGCRAAEPAKVRLGKLLADTYRQQDRRRYNPRGQDDRSPARGPHHDRNGILRAALQEDLAAGVPRAAQHNDDLPGLAHPDDGWGGAQEVDPGQS